MWYLTLAQLFSSFANEDQFVTVYRISIGFIQINPIDALVYCSLPVALLFGNRAHAAPKNRIHPMMFIIIGLLLVGGVCGWIEAVINHTSPEFVLRQARDHFAWPVCIFAGYRLLPNPRSAWKYMYVLALAGVITAMMTITHFADKAEDYSWNKHFNELRTVEFLIAYAGLGSALFFYSIIRRPLRLVPTWMAIPCACFCLVGQFAPLSRGEWIEGLCCIICLISLIPSGERLSALIKSITMISLLLVALYFAVVLASIATHRDFFQTVQERVLTLIPGSDTQTHAWDTRVGSISQELDIWMKNPIFGQGFGAQQGEVAKGDIENAGAYFHNGWSSQLATTGLFGFAGFMSIIASFFVVGRRLVLSNQDRGTVLMGAYCFASSVYLALLTLSSMIWFSRGALLFGVLCGMMLRLRDIQLTEAGMESSRMNEQEISEFEPIPHEALVPANDAFF